MKRGLMGLQGRWGILAAALIVFLAFIFWAMGPLGRPVPPSPVEESVASCDIERYQQLYANALAVFWRSLFEAGKGDITHEGFLTANQTAIGFDPQLRLLFDQSTTGRVPPDSYGTALNATYFKAMSGTCEADVEGEDA